jgi:hypothetical protein
VLLLNASICHLFMVQVLSSILITKHEGETPARRCPSHPSGSHHSLHAKTPDAAGNVGGEEEEAAVRSAAAAIQASCQGLVDFLVQVEQQQQQRQQQQQQQQQQQEQQEEELQGAADGSPREQTDGGGGGPRLGDALTAAVREMEAMDWLVPPMLQPR